MVFNSLLNLIQDDFEGVYKFICRVFYESYEELDLDECQLIYSAIINVRKMENRSFDDFIECFDCDGHLYPIINELRPDGEYGIFTNEKEVVVSELDGVALILTSDFFDIFTKEVGIKSDNSAVICNSSMESDKIRYVC